MEGVHSCCCKTGYVEVNGKKSDPYDKNIGCKGKKLFRSQFRVRLLNNLLKEDSPSGSDGCVKFISGCSYPTRM